ncbi:hypothetical protein ROZALSC1DRAFT_28128 [Rozella allomycis CSF55]|uniref:U6 snRNA phosphodiesterase 1 n=1 Tax=Rozella allomycis (strain CSF55) TaxID=988480 RepID=A0A4V1J055_ROZAC|nr:hypothetical protein ROZALSC1DRAFT_28128 [Rozella allomycis CSF55]
MKNDKKVGLFPLIVYLPVELDQVLLDKIYNEIPSDFKPIDENDVPLHISLSKNEVLPHHCIEGFSDALVKGLREAEIAKFRVTMKRFNRYKNENGDKDFIAIDIDKGSKKILGIVDIVNNVMKRYGLNLYYDVTLSVYLD